MSKPEVKKPSFLKEHGMTIALAVAIVAIAVYGITYTMGAHGAEVVVTPVEPTVIHSEQVMEEPNGLPDYTAQEESVKEDEASIFTKLNQFMCEHTDVWDCPTDQGAADEPATDDAAEDVKKAAPATSA